MYSICGDYVINFIFAVGKIFHKMYGIYNDHLFWLAFGCGCGHLSYKNVLGHGGRILFCLIFHVINAILLQELNQTWNRYVVDRHSITDPTSKSHPGSDVRPDPSHSLHSILDSIINMYSIPCILSYLILTIKYSIPFIVEVQLYQISSILCILDIYAWFYDYIFLLCYGLFIGKLLWQLVLWDQIIRILQWIGQIESISYRITNICINCDIIFAYT